MGEQITHTVGVYLILLVIACLVGIAAKKIARLPYTIFLTLIGLGIGLIEFGPSISDTGFSHDLIFFVFLPPLLFHGAMHMNVNRLLKHLVPILCFAIPGVIVSTVLVGGVVHWFAGVQSVLIALLFGALITPTDPVSVLALFRKASAPEDLKTLVEGESLFNDATGVVLFSILLAAVIGGTDLSIGTAALEFGKVSAGGLVVGGGLGLLTFYVLRGLDDHLLENAICLVLAYGSFWLAESLHISGVIAVVMAGLLIGNYGRRFSMSQKTIETVETFFESVGFLLNSFLFILIGLELREIPADIAVDPIQVSIVAIAAMLLGRASVVYSFYWLLNRGGHHRPPKWKHIIFWGGLRGSIPIALLLHLPSAMSLPADHILLEYRPVLLVAGFSCVFFSLVVQGLTMAPLMQMLNIGRADMGK